MKQSHKTLLLWVLLILMFLAIWQVLEPERAAPTRRVQRVHRRGPRGPRRRSEDQGPRVHASASARATPRRPRSRRRRSARAPDEQLLETLKPDNKEAPAPKIYLREGRHARRSGARRSSRSCRCSSSASCSSCSCASSRRAAARR